MHRNIRLLELQEIMMSALFILPVLIPYFYSEIGLTFKDFLIAEVFFAATVILLEVPSGWISDIWKRKHVLTLATFFWGAGYGVFLFATGLISVTISFMIMAISLSLLSGTNTALLYDTLLSIKKENLFSKLEGRRKAGGFYMTALSALIGGFLYEIDHQLPIILGISSTTIGLILCFFIIEPPRKKKEMHKNPFADMAITMKYALHGHTVVGMILIFAAMLFCSTKLIMWIQQPYYMELKIPEIYFGVLMAVGYGLGGLASHINHLTESFLDNFKAIILAWLLAIIVCVGSAITIGMHGIFLLMLGGTFIYGAATPRIQDAINKRVESERRATIISTGNLLKEICFIPLTLILAWTVSTYNLSTGLYVIAIWLFIAGSCLAFWALKSKRAQ